MAGYSIDLASISIDEFAETLLAVELLPGRRVLADHIASLTPRLADRGVKDLSELRRLLAGKGAYPDLATELGVDVSYLTVLNREVNSYVSKPLALTKLGYLTEAEVVALAGAGIKSTKDLYARCVVKADRLAVVADSRISQERLERALTLCNLVRINGVGPAFAEFLLEAGIRGPKDFLDRDLAQMVIEYASQVGDTGPKLRIEDLEYVQRYCRGLTEDIEW